MIERSARAKLVRFGCFALGGCGLLALGAATPELARAPAEAAPEQRRLPPPPPGGTMGFLIDQFGMRGVQDKDACPDGGTMTLRESYLAHLPAAERARLSLKENEPELTRRWQGQVYGADGSNLCSQPDRFERPAMSTVKGRYAWGFDLDGGKNADGCAHEEFQTPTGEAGIDNQEYRVLGCGGRPPAGTPAAAQAAADAQAAARNSEGARGMNQFMASGEWTQVILLRGVDSLENDPAVEVVYGNTADPPPADAKGQFLPGSSFTISDKGARHRNVLKGRIVDGVLTTEPADIRLAQTWGQGGVREIRGARWKYTFMRARIRLEFQADGSIRGMIGGYRPAIELISAPTLGGAGSATTAGIDCAATIQAANRLADGMRDPRTGKCTAVSSAYRIGGIPAFVNDTPQRTAAR
jgi:hypothetical protein